MIVNEQANLTKAKILKEEQHQATEKIDSIIAQIQQISNNEKLQHLGSEVITKTNITTNSNVGTKPPGQIPDKDLFQQRPTSNKREKTTLDKNKL
jgi:hypothetical protein